MSTATVEKRIALKPTTMVRKQRWLDVREFEVTSWPELADLPAQLAQIFSRVAQSRDAVLLE